VSEAVDREMNDMRISFEKITHGDSRYPYKTITSIAVQKCPFGGGHADASLGVTLLDKTTIAGFDPKKASSMMHSRGEMRVGP
jgi:hypothetical protein